MIRLSRQGFTRTALALVAAGTLLGATACGSDDDTATTTAGGSDTTASTTASTEKATVAFFGLAASNAYTQYMYEAAKAAGAEANADVEFFDGKFEGPAQIAQVQDAITSGKYDAFIIMPNDTTGIAPVVKQAADKGIKVAALQFPIGPDPVDPKPQVEGVVTSVIEDVQAGARVTAESINAMCVERNPCEVGILWGSRKLPWDGAAKRPVLVDTLDDNVKIVAETDAGFLQPDGEKATADMLQANRGLDVLATPSGDQMTLGGERAIETAGKKVSVDPARPEGEVAIVGYGASKAGVERVRDGKWFSTYALVPESMSRSALEMILASVRGEEVKSDGIGQIEISPIGDNVTTKILEEHPDFQAEWEG